MNELISAYYCPSYLPIEGFAVLAYLKFKELTPKVTGNMASYDDYTYDEDNRLVYLTNVCIYVAYQNYETCLMGWFDDATAEAFQHALSVTPRLEKGQEEDDWYEQYSYRNKEKVGRAKNKHRHK